MEEVEGGECGGEQSACAADQGDERYSGACGNGARTCLNNDSERKGGREQRREKGRRSMVADRHGQGRM